jgi:GAF domain-containing protein
MLEVRAAEHEALRRVATLVAQAVPLEEVFGAVTAEAGAVLGANFAGMARFDGDAVRVVAAWAADGPHPPVPDNWRMHPGDPATTVAETGEPARWDGWQDVPGEIAEFIRALGVQCTVACPILVEGKLWGALAVHSTLAPLPEDAESRVTQFNDLVAMAIANAQARAEVARLADEQAALRRVATSVAANAPQNEVFAAIAESVAELFGTEDISMARFEGDHSRVVVAASGRFPEAFPVGSRQELTGDNAGSRVRDTHAPVRIDDYSTATGAIAEAARGIGIRAVVATPITVEGRLWGQMSIGTTGEEPLPPDTERRLGQFTELMATAVANAESRAEVERLAEEQAALRTVATLVAQGVEPAQLVSAVSEEVARLFADVSPSLVPSVIRFDPGPEFALVGAAQPMLDLPVGSRWPPKDLYVSTRVYRSGASARVDAVEVESDEGPDGALLRRQGFLYQVGSPIVVEGRLWGALTMNSTEPLPGDTGARLESFTELVATAIANAESRAAVERLAEEQAALGRVATVVAREASQGDVFTALSDEVRQLLGGDEIWMLRYESGDTAVLVAESGKHPFGLRVGRRLPLIPDGPAARVFRTGRPVRMDTHEAVGEAADLAREAGLRSVAAAPIAVEGRRWGAVVVGASGDEPLPPDTEARLDQFTDLMATAVANAESRAEVERLADEQAALRRVATLVAEGASPSAVLDAVAAEMEALLDADQVALNRFEPGDEIAVLAHRGLDVDRTPVGSRVSIEGRSATAEVRRTRRPARVEDYQDAEGPLAALARETGLRSSVSVPVTVEGRLWGLITASWKSAEPPPSDTEERMEQFATLLDTAIANADTRDQLNASRARLVTEGDEARRQVVRDLHDGAQQRLVHTIVTLKLAKRAFRDDAGNGKAEQLLVEALQHAENGNEELRELAHGIQPAVLARGGLLAGIQAFVGRVAIPVDLDVPAERLPAEIEASAYFIIAEALTNVVKHSGAARAHVKARVDQGCLRLEVRDNGAGGADSNGHGLLGIADRAAALGGRLDVETTPAGTVISAMLPMAASQAPWSSSTTS